MAISIIRASGKIVLSGYSTKRKSSTRSFRSTSNLKNKMKLKYADIVNFRSIQSIKVDFEPFCRVLVGINESGKSNILRALSMVGEEYAPTAEDVREPL